MPVPLYGDGRNVRDWLHVDDHCRAIDLLIEQRRQRRGLQHRRRQRGHERRSDAPDPRRPRQAADAHHAGGRSAGPRSPLLPRHHEAARRSAGRRACRSRTACASTIDWYRHNEWWWRPIKEQDPAFKAYYAGAVPAPAVSDDARSGDRRRRFAGSHLVEHLLPRRRRRLDAVRPPAGRAWRRQRVDLLDRDRVRAAHSRAAAGAASITAPASRTSPSRGRTRRSRSRATCSPRTICSTRCAARAVRCRVLVTGSATVYAPSSEPIDEVAPLAPASPYALSKLAQEQLALRAMREDGLDVVVTRSFNHTGPRQTPAFAAPSMAHGRLRSSNGAARAGHQGRATSMRSRDLTDVRDVVRAYAALMTAGTAGHVYNVASGVGRLDPVDPRRAGRPVARAGPDRTGPDALRPNDVPMRRRRRSRLAAATGLEPGDLLRPDARRPARLLAQTHA